MPFPSRTGVCAAACFQALLAAPVNAGTLTGTATFRERIALPPDAAFEAVIEDTAPADAPAAVISGTHPSRSVSSVLGRLPASWQGDIPDAGGSSRWHLDLASDGSYQLRQTFLGRPAPNRFDDVGRWRIEPATNRLMLRGGREAPLFLQPIEAGNVLRKLDLEGKPINSRHNDRLSRLPKPAPIDPSLNLQGMFLYLADAAVIRLCATGQRLPVAMEGDYRALERAYTQAQEGKRSGQPLLASLQGLITTRPSAEPGQPPRRTLVVQKFLNVWPGQGCPPSPGA
jgi:uncharacterized lipoprotein NlpE involved in copper resistance